MTLDHKLRLKEYFDGEGFARWSAIYGDAELSGVRRTIRAGHERMLATATAWLDERFAQLAGEDATLLDAGCGTGLFAVAMAKRGWSVAAADIAPQMVAATTARAREHGVAERLRTHVGDADELGGVYGAVVCFDVLIHYPRPALETMLGNLARRTRGPLLFTYAPYAPLLAALHWLGGRFPRANRRTDIQMTPRPVIEAALTRAGRTIRRETQVRSGFYHVNLVEAMGDGR